MQRGFFSLKIIQFDFVEIFFFLILFDKVIMKIFNDVGYRLKLRGFFC